MGPTLAMPGHLLLVVYSETLMVPEFKVFLGLLGLGLPSRLSYGP
ncbi:uncharacterized protein G2W53_014211 [Senna tora]|uniref:Uncharacterized protein n=1 Tax=Senna tora TaxID=362788 RepID=A0A834WSZ9_9FABA|nr:uncharacterized protein G2W53_014211 [Senna tora]